MISLILKFIVSGFLLIHLNIIQHRHQSSIFFYGASTIVFNKISYIFYEIWVHIIFDITMNNDAVKTFLMSLFFCDATCVKDIIKDVINNILFVLFFSHYLCSWCTSWCSGCLHQYRYVTAFLSDSNSRCDYVDAWFIFVKFLSNIKCDSPPPPPPPNWVSCYCVCLSCEHMCVSLVHLLMHVVHIWKRY